MNPLCDNVEKTTAAETQTKKTMNIEGLTNHESYVLKTLFMKAIKSRVTEETLNKCWSESGIVGRDKFEEAFAEGVVMEAISHIEEAYAYEI